MIKKIGITIIVFILIIVVLVLILNKNRTEDSEVENREIGEDFHYYIDSEKIKEETILELEDIDKYFVIKNCIDIYTNAINKQNDRYYNMNEQNKLIYSEANAIEMHKEIINLIEKDYKEKNKITVDNINEKIDFFDTKVITTMLETKIYIKDNIEHYIIKCMFQDIKFNYLEERFIEVILDTKNNTFEIKPLKNITSMENIEITKNIKNIENKIFNKYREYSIEIEDLVKEYLNIYKRTALGKPEYLYNMLDEEYKNLRFGNVEEFKKFIYNNKNKITGLRVEGYNNELTEEYNQYIIKDQYNQHYIVNEVNISNFSYILDLYTVDLEQFIEKYNNSEDTTKVALNIEKIKEAINQTDYKYVYSKLNESFKKSNFNTIEKFEKYVKENFYKENEIKYVSTEEKGNYFIVNVKIINKENSEEFKTEKFIVNLLEGTDFEISFNIEK